MSGDVQPRKRKDKKRKKDDLGLEEPRGTSAVFGEGDVFIHSQHNHGTGGHWCAKIIFFSLLAVLVTLIGLIILENRGLSELEANSVESRYSGVLNGWIEETPGDDHHDEHTLELRQHDEKKNELESDEQDNDENVEDEIISHSDEHDDNDIDDNDEDENDNDSEEKSVEENQEEDEEEVQNFRRYFADSAEEESLDNENYKYDQSHEHPETEEQEYDNDDTYFDSTVKIKNKRDDDAIYKENLLDDQNDIANDFSAVDEKEDNDHDFDSEENNDESNGNPRDDDYDSNIDDDSREPKEERESYEEVEKEINHHKQYFTDSAEKQTDPNENDDSDEFLQNHENYKSEEIEYYDKYSNERDNNYKYVDSMNDYSTQSQERENLKYDTEHDEDDDHNEEEEEEVEIERIEKEVSEDVVISSELPALPEQDDDDTGNAIDEKDAEQEDNSEEASEDELFDTDDELDEPIVEQITVPAGKPFVEVDEETSSEKPTPPVPDTLAEEEEYEKQQEELRREEEQASHVWLKLSVGGALLAATHVVLRRIYASPDVSESEESSSNEKASTAIDRRMTLIPEETSVPVTPETEFSPELSNPIRTEDLEKSLAFIHNSPVVPKQDREDEEGMEIPFDVQNSQTKMSGTEIAHDQELYSEDDDDIEEEEDEIFGENQEKNGEEIIHKHDLTLVSEEMPDDVEIIDDEPLEEEIEEEEISDVDDAELLSRLEAKYGRLPEPERPTPKHKDGGNSVEDEWPGEPSDSYWRQQLDKAEDELQQDWMD